MSYSLTETRNTLAGTSETLVPQGTNVLGRSRMAHAVVMTDETKRLAPPKGPSACTRNNKGILRHQHVYSFFLTHIITYGSDIYKGE